MNKTDLFSDLKKILESDFVLQFLLKSMEQWKTSRFNYFLPLQCFFPMLNPPLVSFLSKNHNFQVLKKGFLLLISPKFLVVFSQYAKIFHLELLNLKLTIFVKYHASTLCTPVPTALFRILLYISAGDRFVHFFCHRLFYHSILDSCNEELMID